MKKITRRRAIQIVSTATFTTGTTACSVIGSKSNHVYRDSWSNTPNRVWLGGDYWANPMEDWCIKGGAAECLTNGGTRSVHLLTHQIKNSAAGFEMSVHVERLESGETDGGAGFRLGVKSELNEYRSNCFVQDGLDIGIQQNNLVIGAKKYSLPDSVSIDDLQLTLSVAAGADKGLVSLVLRAFNPKGVLLGELQANVSSDKLVGNVAIVSNFANLENIYNGARYRFSDWILGGDAFEVSPERKFGPILWSMYTLSDSRANEGFVLKISAITGPMVKDSNQKVELKVLTGGAWKSLGYQSLDQDAWVATFRVPNWAEQNDTPYKLIYKEVHLDGSVSEDIYSGTIKANPVGRPMKMAAMTCQNDYGFPYAPVALNIEKTNPDIVFFSGDQIYESHGGFGYHREPSEKAILCYLRKYYQFGWAFREVMRNNPTVCLPDDHDVLQGNLWGEGGSKMQNPEKDPGASILGGYVEPVRVINAVHRTTVSHHPDAYDPTPMPRGISVYFGDMVYGDVGFAIIADRQWKSGPERINVTVGVTGNDEEPTYYNPKFNPPGLELLGKRQEDFLKLWGEDWRGHKLKAVLSQTVFSGIATHQPDPDRYLKYDFDGSGWPAKARDRAISIMRSSRALHICGDTHLTTLSQYGVEKQRDSNWAFCTPAIAAGWPRWWLPDKAGLPHVNRPEHGIENTGEYLDSFGNKIYVYAVGNPVVGKDENRYARAHEKGSGFGVIVFDTQALTYTMESYKFLIDVTDGNPANQFPGWPVTIHKEENSGKNRLT